MVSIAEIEHLAAQLEAEISASLAAIETRLELDRRRGEVFGPEGRLTRLTRSLGSLPKADRPTAGKLINGTKRTIEARFSELAARIEEAELERTLGEPIDASLSDFRTEIGLRHPLSLIRDRIVAIFRLLGFTIADGTELETEWFCFDALHMPATHPARDTMDTFFLPERTAARNVTRKERERFVLRTHTTTVQIHTLMQEGAPVKVIAPGRVFRRDTVDATHSANFHQCDVIHVDRNLSVRDLKNTIDFFLREFFGNRAEVRYRPSFFPFTEPSFEVDVRVPNLGKLSNKWIEICGCGMIDPAVFQAVGIDPEVWSGQAWGIGLERMAMLHYGIDDVRHFYRNDLRFLAQFN